MRKLLLIAVALLLPSLASAQILDFNGNVVAGASYLLASPGPGLKRVQFFLTGNVTGVAIGTNTNLYIGGVGVDLRTVNQAFGQVTGLGLSVPFLTYYPKGGKILVQGGYSRDLIGTAQSNGIYAGAGYGFTSPKAIRLARARKAAQRELLEQAKREHPNHPGAAPPPPEN
jgi:hypothetical protein